MVWNVWGGYRLKNNCDDVADGKERMQKLICVSLCRVMLHAFVPMSETRLIEVRTKGK